MNKKVSCEYYIFTIHTSNIKERYVCICGEITKTHTKIRAHLEKEEHDDIAHKKKEFVYLHKICYNGQGAPIFTDLEKATAHINKLCKYVVLTQQNIMSSIRKEKLMCDMSECFTQEMIVKMKIKVTEHRED